MLSPCAYIAANLLINIKYPQLVLHGWNIVTYLVNHLDGL